MVEILDAIDSVLYYPILLVVMAAAGLYFSLRMGFVQIHRLPEGMRLVMAKPTDEKGTSPFQALMVSSAALERATLSESLRQSASAVLAPSSG